MAPDVGALFGVDAELGHPANGLQEEEPAGGGGGGERRAAVAMVMVLAAPKALGFVVAAPNCRVPLVRFHEAVESKVELLAARMILPWPLTLMTALLAPPVRLRVG